jgi:hypothetical protein
MFDPSVLVSIGTIFMHGVKCKVREGHSSRLHCLINRVLNPSALAQIRMISVHQCARHSSEQHSLGQPDAQQGDPSFANEWQQS